MLSTTLPLLPIIFMPLVNNSHNRLFLYRGPKSHERKSAPLSVGNTQAVMS